jgi:hypothetical protein
MTPAVREPQPLVLATGVPKTPAPKKDWSGFLQTARKRFQMAAEAERSIRQEALADLKFYAGEQWPLQVRTDRELTNRPCLTINRLPQFAKQIINAQRTARPSIQVNPVGDGADVDTAQIIQGLMRHIEINSDAEVAYDTAFEHAVIHGFGYFRLTTDYADADSGPDQEIKIERVLNPFAVYYDPTAQQPDRSDAQFCFVVEDIPFEQYKAIYGDSVVAGLADFRSVGDSERDWFTNGGVRVAEYFWIETKEVRKVKLSDGRIMNEEDATEYDEVAQRWLATKRTVRWCRMNAREVLEPNTGEPATWPGRYIPIISVLGDELIVDGKKKLIGMVRHARDAQRMFNFAHSGVAELIALAPKSPYLVAEGQIEGHEEQWRQMNNRNTPFLTWKPISAGGQLVPAPIRNQAEPPIQGLNQLLMQSDQNLKSTTGIYDPGLGEKTADQSGKAIGLLQGQGEVANANYMDNLKRSMAHAGRAILDLIPHVYDVPRITRIVDPDQSHRMVQINQPFLEQGVLKLFDVTTGRYDVTISVGPNYQSKRQEFVQSVLALVQAVPQVMQYVMDLLVSNMDWPGAKEIAERLKKMLPPPLQDPDDPNQQQPPIPPQAQAQMAQMQQALEIIGQQNQQMAELLKTKILDLQSKERIATQTNQARIYAAEAGSKSALMNQLAQLDHKTLQAELDRRADLLRAGMDVEADAYADEQERQHQLNMQQQEQAHAASMQDAAQQHEAAMAEAAQRNAGPQITPTAQQPQAPPGQ